ncbi:4-alpha-glucanotransferase [Endozoicomonas sp.]|uniref:4-alpha-glucanotransferase n=1 Tax=Endozoicomonas sp. TaxID=1892382 RepID=UPI002886C236|nr:4-alpha-glucanotransferase [Endozoicomonas sp.]
MDVKTDIQRIERLAECYGLSGEYNDWAGNPVKVPVEKMIPMLKAMGLKLDSDKLLDEQIEQVEKRRWASVLPAVAVLHKGRHFELEVHLPVSKLKSTIKLHLTLENGKDRLLELSGKEGQYQELTRKKLGRTTVVRLNAFLPDDLPEGYHRLQLLAGKNKKSDKRGKGVETCFLIIAPETCYEPQALADGQKIWGSAIQLYTLRSARNWGMGDFTDLKEAVKALAAKGANIVGLNPIHALYPAGPQHCSPYSPSSRNFLNPLYIDIEAVAEFECSDKARQLMDNPEFQRKLAEARFASYVDYPKVAELKMAVLESLYETFVSREVSAKTCRSRQFKQFCKARGESLERQARYDVLFEYHLKQDVEAWGWHHWPAALQNPYSKETTAFIRAHKERVRFYTWLQWVADCQLEDAQQAAEQAGMLVGLYRDLAVGVDRGGADVWSDRNLYCLDASVGAPPDGAAPRGQNWGLPPFNPQALADSAYQPFIEMVRANMDHCGALRIDHVMGLFRLWWCPNGMTADHGCYVRYPLQDLLGIIKLESQRHQSLVFGEDLGTVPEEISESLPPAKFYSNTVGLFEKSASDRFTAPADYPGRTLACLSNHDIPTLNGWWNCLDLDLWRELGTYDEARCEREKNERHVTKVALLKTLADIGELPPGMDPERMETMAFSRELEERLHYYLVRSNALITVIQLEDCLMLDTPVNVPGTCDEYPNWRRRLTGDISELVQQGYMERFLEDVNIIRNAERSVV